MRSLVDSHVSQAGIAQTTKQSSHAPVKSIFFDQMRVVKYESSLGIVNQKNFDDERYLLREEGETVT